MITKALYVQLFLLQKLETQFVSSSQPTTKNPNHDKKRKVSKSSLRLSSFMILSLQAKEGRCCQHSSCALLCTVHELASRLPRDSAIDTMDFPWVFITTGEGQEHTEELNIEQKHRGAHPKEKKNS